MNTIKLSIDTTLDKIQHKLLHTTLSQAITAILYGICVLVIMWLLASYIDLNAHNMTDCSYSSWNLITLAMAAK